MVKDVIKDEDIETNVKLLECSKRKFHTKIMDTISRSIALSQFDLATKTEGVKMILGHIYLYTQNYVMLISLPKRLNGQLKSFKES